MSETHSGETVFVECCAGRLAVGETCDACGQVAYGEHQPPRKLGPPIKGMEWSGLRARNSLSLIPPDESGTYTVRILEDGTFTVAADFGSYSPPSS